MSTEASDALKKALDERLAKLARQTKVEVTFNVNLAVAVKVAGNMVLNKFYADSDDDFSKELREALVVLQAALDNC